MLPKGFCPPAADLVCLGFCLDLRLQLQRDLAQLPLFQISAIFLRVQRPLLGFQQILEGEYRHRIGQAMLFAQ